MPASCVRSIVLNPAAPRAVASSGSAVGTVPWPPQRETTASNIEPSQTSRVHSE